MRSELVARFVVAFAMFSLLALAALAPCEAFFGNESFYALFRGVCHQRADRCFQLFGYPMAVCARCAFIYLGVAVGALSLPLMNERNRHYLLILLGVSAGLVGLDIACELVRLYDNVFATRAVSGFLLGLPMGAMGATALNESLGKRFATPSKAT
ncbi:MAG: DUF2085 domain-containing protein [Chloroherpetonaceae bacterium]|nr:DUF2085 domain-containing protein [Chloroherpetonaceae bacterium]MDW8438053.1 DUF2085 domain-containing protein [Chloroherpetonaceae bacterium]